MNRFILIIQITLLAFTGALSALLYVMIRQIGLIRQRIPKEKVQGLPIGSKIPVTEFVSYDETARYEIPFAGNGPSFILFIAFSCPTCQGLLEELPRLRENVRMRVALFILDSGIKDRYADRIAKLEDFRIVEGQPFVEAFQMVRSPFMYLVDEQGNVLEKGGVLSIDELVKISSNYKANQLGNVYAK